MCLTRTRREESDAALIFYGLQKMTLLDYPGFVACTLFTGGCNLRCPFCHNADLVSGFDESFPNSSIPEEEILSFLNKRRGLLDGVCITGGEPLLWKELPAFLEKVKGLSFSIKLDTNGTFPDRLEAVLSAGLVDSVAMDLKNCREKYALTSGIPGLDLSGIERSICLLRSSSVDYEFRTTVVAEYHTPEDIAAVADWVAGAKRYRIQSFTDSGRTLTPGLHAHPKEVLEEMLALARLRIPDTELRGV